MMSTRAAARSQRPEQARIHHRLNGAVSAPTPAEGHRRVEGAVAVVAQDERSGSIDEHGGLEPQLDGEAQRLGCASEVRRPSGPEVLSRDSAIQSDATASSTRRFCLCGAKESEQDTRREPSAPPNDEHSRRRLLASVAHRPGDRNPRRHRAEGAKWRRVGGARALGMRAATPAAPRGGGSAAVLRWPTSHLECLLRFVEGSAVATLWLSLSRRAGTFLRHQSAFVRARERPNGKQGSRYGCRFGAARARKFPRHQSAHGRARERSNGKQASRNGFRFGAARAGRFPRHQSARTRARERSKRNQGSRNGLGEDPRLTGIC